jgi:diguanylate cyclase (GGDEF)-like protein/PAS domain S-box-containing protein
VGELARGREETVNVVSACFDGKNADNFNYDLAGTPCEHIISRGPCAYPSKVQKLFPQDHYLVDMGVECYIGVPLFGSSGQPLGLISVMGRQPLRDRETAESVLQIVAARTATEIERQHLHQDLGDSHRTLARLIENLPGMVYRCRNDKDWTLEFASDGCLELTGYSPEDFIGARRISYGQLIHAEDQELVWNQVQASVREKRPFQLVYRIATAKGEQKWVWEQGRGVFSPQGELLVLEGFITDITARKRGEEIAARFGHVLDDSSNEIYVFDAVTLKFVQVNLGARRNLGYSAEELAALTPLDLKPEYTRETFETLIAPLKRHEVDTLTFETVHRRKNGSLYPVEVRLQLSYAENPPVFVALITDITERIKAQAQLEFLAHHDALTRLPNRALFLERLNHALTRTHWTKRSLAVLFLDMDRFKNINDTLGHNIGDSALNVVAQRLVGCVRDGDTVARLGGDEFTVLLEDLAIADDVPAIAQKIIEVLSQPFVTEGREFIITASIGISLYPGDGEDSGTLLRHADTAMYRAKEQGRNKYQFYSAEMSAKALEKYTLETSLRHALERGEFILYYQPQVSLTTGRIMGVEALLRWRHPELGLLQPLQFIPVAEETGLMKSIDEWVMETSCAQAKIWQSGCMIPLSLTVNLSSRTFSEPHLVEKVANVLNQTGMEPRLLELEITENIVMEHAKDTVERLGALSRMGIRLAIDDFGTGYSSLGYLKRFPIDTLKIDKSFVNDITTDEDDATIVTAIIAMGKSLQLRVVAEGVETKGQLTFLREQQCDGMQGYLFSRPVPAEEMTSLIKSGKKLF